MVEEIRFAVLSGMELLKSKIVKHEARSYNKIQKLCAIQCAQRNLFLDINYYWVGSPYLLYSSYFHVCVCVFFHFALRFGWASVCFVCCFFFVEKGTSSREQFLEPLFRPNCCSVEQTQHLFKILKLTTKQNKNNQHKPNESVECNRKFRFIRQSHETEIK